jgi:Ca2+-binding RTX toxin-like protein
MIIIRKNDSEPRIPYCGQDERDDLVSTPVNVSWLRVTDRRDRAYKLCGDDGLEGSGGSGNDLIRFGEGEDFADRLAGNDDFGGTTAYADWPYGDARNDLIFGDGGNDRSRSDAGRDIPHGGEGDGLINGDARIDLPYGAGADGFVFRTLADVLMSGPTVSWISPAAATRSTCG